MHHSPWKFSLLRSTFEVPSSSSTFKLHMMYMYTYKYNTISHNSNHYGIRRRVLLPVELVQKKTLSVFLQLVEDC